MSDTDNTVRSDEFQIYYSLEDDLYWLSSDGGDGESIGLTVEQFNKMCSDYMEENF